MYITENSLNYIIKGYSFIKCNRQKTIFYNIKKSKYINSTKNGGSYGIWHGKKWLSISKIELIQENKIVNASNDLSNLLKDLEAYS